LKRQWYTDLILVFVFGSWALAFVLIKMALGADGGFTPLAFLWPRMALSAVVLFAMLPVIGAPAGIPREHLLKTVGIGVIGLAGYHVLFTVGLALTTPVDTALIVGTGPVMTALWMPLFGMERPRGRAWLGIVICFLSVAAITIRGAWSAAAAGWDTQRLLGDIVMLIASNCWALNGILCRRAAPFMKSATMTAWGLLWASIVLVPFCAVAMVRQDWTAVTPTGWWCFVYAILPASTVSVILFYYGVKKVGPLHTIIYQNVSPLITAGLVYLIMRDHPVPNETQVVGVFTIFIGVYLTRTSH
jgi:drug/metabolite transporter (DMT)-like permease